MKHSLLLSLLMFVYLGVFGKTPIMPTQNAKLDSLQFNIDSQQAIIESQHSSLRTLQDSIQNLQIQISKLEGEVQNVSKDNSRMNTNMAFWLAILTITMALLGIGFGIIAPLGINRESAKNAHKAKLLANKAQNQVTEALKAVKDSRKKVQQAHQAMDEAKKNAENGFKKAKAVQFFIQALQESDENRAIALYDNCIDLDNQFAEAYNNRGFLRHKKSGPDAIIDAMKDYTTAITLVEKQGHGIYAEAYNNRGILYFENKEFDKAKNDFETAITKEYAEAYLNLGLLNYRNGKDVNKDFNIAIEKNPNSAEAHYIRGLWRYTKNFDKEYAINDFANAITIKKDVVESYPNRALLTGEMKDLDNSLKGVEYSKDMKTLIRLHEDKEEPFIILEGTTRIGGYAFAGNTRLNVLKIPNSVTEIGQCAFSGCTGLESIEITGNVNRIGEWAFEDCSNLKEIHIKRSVPIVYSIVAFDRLDISKIKLYVPKGSSDAYQKNKYYERFDEIKEE